MQAQEPDRPEKEVTAFPRTTEALGADIKGSPEVRHADRVRRADDERTAARQDHLEEAQERAAEALEENAERLQRSGGEVHAAGERLEGSRARVEAIADDAEALRGANADLRRAAGRIDVDGDPDR